MKNGKREESKREEGRESQLQRLEAHIQRVEDIRPDLKKAEVYWIIVTAMPQHAPSMIKALMAYDPATMVRSYLDHYRSWKQQTIASGKTLQIAQPNLRTVAETMEAQKNDTIMEAHNKWLVGLSQELQRTVCPRKTALRDRLLARDRAARKNIASRKPKGVGFNTDASLAKSTMRNIDNAMPSHQRLAMLREMYSEKPRHSGK